MALKVLHDVQKAVIYLWVVTELNFDLVKIAQSILRKTKRVSNLTKIFGSFWGGGNM